MIEPKEITIVDSKGIEHKYIISRIPYASGGREICSQFIPTSIPKLGNYQLNHELFLKMMKYVAVVTDNGQLPLSTSALIDNHVPDVKTGLLLEKEMLEYNFGFFDLGKISAILETFSKKLGVLTTKILMQLQASLSPQEEQPSEN